MGMAMPFHGHAEDVHPYLAHRGSSPRSAPGATSLDVRRYSDENSNDLFVPARI
jgi:hypothetical protein